MSVPSLPLIKRTVATNSTLNFYWLPPLSDGGTPITNYTLICSSINYTETINAASTYSQVSGLINNTEYLFQLNAGNKMGYTPYVPFKISRPGILTGGPRNYALSTINSTTANVVWSFSTNANEAKPDYFVITVIPKRYDSTFTVTAYPEQRNQVVSKLSSTNMYKVIVQSVNDAGYSYPSQSGILGYISSFVNDDAPSSLSSNSVTASGFTVTWSGAVGATSYNYTLNGVTATPSATTVNSATFTNLTANTPYAVIVIATNEFGSSPSSPLSITTAPSAPTTLSASNITTSSFTVSWSGAVGASSFTYSINNITVTPASTTVNSATFTGLAAGTPYSVIVKAVNVGGSTPSPVLSVSTTPSAPTSLISSNITVSGFTVSWSGAFGAASYIYTLNGTPTIPVATTLSSATFTNLNANTPYAVIVTAVNVGGSTPSSSLSVTTAPSAPTSLSSSNITASGFTVSWSGGGGATSYTYTLNGVTTTPADTTISSATFTNLPANTPYTVIVIAVSVAGSTPSSPISIGTAPSAPTSLSPSAITTTGFTVNWSGAAGATSFTYTLNGLSTTPSVATSTSAKFTGLTAGTIYTVIVTAANTFGSTPSSPLSVSAGPGQPTGLTSSNRTASGFTVNWSGGSGATSYSYTLNGVTTTPSATTASSATFTSLTANTPYAVIVTAINTGGSTPSSSFTVTTAPGQPTSLSSSSITTSGFTVSWLGATGATSFTYTLNGLSAVPASSTAGTATFTGLIVFTAYTVIVTAVSASGSTPSSSLSVTTASLVTTKYTYTSISAGYVTGVRFNSAGTNLYVVDYNNSKIIGIAYPSGTASTFISGLTGPGGIAVDLISNLYIPFDSGNVNKITAQAASALLATNAGRYGLTIGSDGYIYVPNSATIAKVSSTGTVTQITPSFTDGSTSSNVGFTNVNMGNDGNLYGVDTNNNRIVKMSTSGANAITFVGGNSGTADGTGRAVGFPSIYRATIDTNGVLYVAAAGKIRIVTTSGVVTTLAGTTGISISELCIGPDGNIWVADNVNNSIRCITMTPPLTAQPLYGLALPPTQPSALSSSAISTTGFTISWSGASGATSFTYTLNGTTTTPSSSTSATATFTGLTAGTTYAVIVTAVNAIGSTASSSLSVSTAPGAPTSLSSSVLSSTGFTVSWSGAAGATSYTYTLNGTQATPATSTSSSATFTGLTATTAYAVIVTAVNSGGSTSSSSFTVTTTVPPPSAPTSLSSSSITSSGFTVSWSGASGATSFTYTLNGAQTTPASSTSGTATFTGLTGGTAYAVIVSAVNAGGSTPSNPLSVTTIVSAPSAPTGLSSSSVTSSGFTVNWSGAVRATSFNYTLNGTTVTPASATSSSVTFSGLNAGIGYTVIVTAVNAGGSTPSSSLSVTTAPAQPTSLSSSSITSSGFTVTWSGASGATSFTYTLNGTATTPASSASGTATFSNLTGGTTYAVIVSAVNAGGSTPSSSLSVTTAPTAPTSLSSSSVTATGFTVSWLGGTGATSYTYTLNGTAVTPASATSGTATFTGLTAGTSYGVIVSAVNAGGSTTSSSLSVTTTVAAPGAPSSLSSSSITSSGFTVSWSGASGATSFTYTLNGTGKTPDSSTGSSATFSGLTASTAYAVIVTAVNAGGSTASSSLSVSTTAAGPPVASGVTTRFSNPSVNAIIGLVFDSEGTNLYYFEYGNGKIYKIIYQSGISSLFANVNHTEGITIDSTNIIYSGVNNIYKITSSGTASILASIGTYSYCMGINGYLYVGNTDVFRVSIYGVALLITPTFIDGTTTLNSRDIYGLTNDSQGNWYMVQPSNHRIIRMSPTGSNAITFAGSISGDSGSSGKQDGTGTAASFYYPFGSCMDSNDYLYVVDQNRSTIRCISPTGVVTTIAGPSGPLTIKSMNAQGICIGPDGNLWVSDYITNSFRSITMSPPLTRQPYYAFTGT